MPRYTIGNDELVFLLFKGTPNDAMCVETGGRSYVAIWLDACHAATHAEKMAGEMLATRFGTLLEVGKDKEFVVVGTDGHIYGPTRNDKP